MLTVTIICKRRQDKVMQFEDMYAFEEWLEDNWDDKCDYWCQDEYNPVAMEYRDILDSMHF